MRCRSRKSGNGSNSRYGSAHGRRIPESTVDATNVDDGREFRLDNTVRIERR